MEGYIILVGGFSSSVSCFDLGFATVFSTATFETFLKYNKAIWITASGY